ncbi:recombination regulator RecX [Loigolactobacillus backii]|uniref:recombination regulator RecX n=1 Tax=Loigolactobacillus backii TaxID=375175 RepID=UPI000B1E4A99|nr:recombination regulator RecX [Loigolactobacillus backii]MDA5388117.1 recombination regulator RecX [Loigolactobacillus backii]MDA5390609.1 recombination regulator RecX [Loigolactobacillus backii]
MALPVITMIEAQRRKGRYNVYLDEQYAFPVSESVLVEYRLFKGMEVPKKLQQTLMAADSVSKAYQLALTYLSRQLRSEMEVRLYLKKHEIPVSARQQIITKLQELNLVNDQDYAESYVRTVMLTSDKGPTVITQKLKEKGIKENLIEDALVLYQTDDLVANGLKAAQKLAKHYQKLSFSQQKQKVRLGLMQKGFSGESLDQILLQLDLEPDPEREWQALVQQGEKVMRQTARLEANKRRQKIKQRLYQKGFHLDEINRFLDEQLTNE